MSLPGTSSGLCQAGTGGSGICWAGRWATCGMLEVACAAALQSGQQASALGCRDQEDGPPGLCKKRLHCCLTINKRDQLMYNYDARPALIILE